MVHCALNTGPRPSATGEDPTVAELMVPGVPLDVIVCQEMDLEGTVHKGYAQDKVLSKIIEHPSEHHSFRVTNGIVWYVRPRTSGADILCIPRAQVEGHLLTEIVLDEAHKTIGHLGTRRTAEYC